MAVLGGAGVDRHHGIDRVEGGANGGVADHVELHLEPELVLVEGDRVGVHDLLVEVLEPRRVIRVGRLVVGGEQVGSAEVEDAVEVDLGGVGVGQAVGVVAVQVGERIELFVLGVGLAPGEQSDHVPELAGRCGLAAHNLRRRGPSWRPSC